MLHKLRALRTNENILIAVDVLLHSKSAFMSIFLMTFLISVSLDSSPVNFIIYCIIRYTLMAVLSLTLMPVLKRYSLTVWRISMVFSIAQILSVIFLDSQASYYIIVISVLSAFESVFYWRPKMYYDMTEVDDNHRLYFKTTGQLLIEIVKIIMPVILGIAISKSSYVRAGTIILIISAVQLLLSILFRPTKKEMAMRPHPYKRFFLNLINHKSLRRLTLMQFIRGLAFSSAAYVVISQINIYRSVSSDLSLGLFTSISSIITIVLVIIYRRLKTRAAQKAVLISIIPATILLPVSLILFPGDTTLSIAFYIVTHSVIESFFNGAVLITRVQQLISSHISDNDERFETEAITEPALSLGRITSLGILLVIILCGHEEYMMILALLESLLVIPIVAMALPAKKKL